MMRILQRNMHSYINSTRLTIFFFSLFLLSLLHFLFPTMTLESSSSSAASNKPEATTASGSELSEFLWQSPLVFNCHFDQAAKHAILLRCYQALWMNDDTIMQQCFFSSEQALQDSLSYQCARHDGKEQHVVNDPSLWHTNAILPNPDLSSQKGRQCGHVFRKGEPVYRCR